MSVAAELAITKDAAVAVVPSFSWLVANAATGYKSMFDYFQPFVGRGPTVQRSLTQIGVNILKNDL
ncbi:MAG TPA: hypothetical protein VE400_00170 [Mycobacterium sp.]|jgi:hypothetical protein|nr:hypothetical protein [Mycobacterium sp.]